MEEISLTDFSLTSMCRLCLSRGVTLFDLFSYTVDFENPVANTIMACAPVQIKKCDGMPNSICQICYTRLVKTHQFQMQIVQSEKTLQRYLERLHGYGTQSKLESSSQRPSNDSLADNTNADITVKRESLELHNVLSDEECGNFNSARKNNCGLHFKNKIKDEPTNNNSLNPEECAGNIVKTPSTQGCEGSDINTENNLLKVEGFSNVDLECGSNEKMSTKLKIKDEQIDAESADDPMQTLFEDGGDEINGEDWKIGIGFVEGRDANWKENEPSNLNPAKIEDSSLILTDCINDTANDFSKGDSEISCENTKLGFGNASACLSSDLDVGFELFHVNETRSSRLSDCKESDANSHPHTGEKPHESNVCTGIFTKTSISNTHNRIQKSEKPYKCNVCNKFFNRPGKLKSHKRLHTGEKPFKCDVCRKCFAQMDNFRSHKRSHTDEKPYKCDVCNKFFKRPGDLKNHKRVHTGEKPFKCDVCKKCFALMGNLKIHKLLHADEKPYKCDVCEKCFALMSHLKTHKLTHTGEKPYKCDVCEKCFAQLGNLRRHTLTHTDEKPYKCDVCEKRFNNSYNLKTHKFIHTGEKPYRCDICDKSLISSSKLKIHKRLHTGVKAYECNICKKCFNRSDNLNNHKRIHTDEKPYKCDVCEKSFNRSDSLNNHKRTHTGEKS